MSWRDVPERGPGNTPGSWDVSDWRSWMRWAVTADWADPATWRRFVLPWTAAPAPAVGPVELEWTSLAEAEPGEAFAAHWARLGEPLERWWRSDGRGDGGAAPDRAEAMLERHMPELLPVWQRLVDLAGGSSLAASILALWDPPPFLTG